MTTKSERTQQMFDLVEKAQESHLSKRQFCEQHGIATQTFYYCKKIYHQQNGHASEGFVPLSLNTAKAVSYDFIEITYPNGIILRIEGQPDAGFISRLIKA